MNIFLKLSVAEKRIYLFFCKIRKHVASFFVSIEHNEIRAILKNNVYAISSPDKNVAYTNVCAFWAYEE